MSGLDPVPQLTQTVAPLFGRDEVVRVAAESSESVLLLTGDSGTGKTEVLRAAQQQTASTASPPPITVVSGAGSLQRSLLAGLGDAVAQIVEQRGLLAEIGQRLTEAAKRLAADSGREALKVPAQAVLLKVKEKVGADGVDLVTTYVAPRSPRPTSRSSKHYGERTWRCTTQSETAACATGSRRR